MWLHLGNIEWRGEDISGMAVNIAARVMDVDKGNDIVITKNLADLISGSELKLKSLVNISSKVSKMTGLFSR